MKSSDTEQVFFSKGKNNGLSNLKRSFIKELSYKFRNYNCNIEGHYSADSHKPKRNKDKKINFSVKENMKEDDKDNDANFLFQTYRKIYCSDCEIEIIEYNSLEEQRVNENVDEHEKENDQDEIVN